MTPAYVEPAASGLGRWRRYTAIGVLVVVAAVGIAFLLASVVEATRNSNERLAQVLKRLERLELSHTDDVHEHRAANQADHDCIVALALLLADPKRDPTAAVIPPRPCRTAPAATETGAPR